MRISEKLQLVMLVLNQVQDSASPDLYQTLAKARGPETSSG